MVKLRNKKINIDNLIKNEDNLIENNTYGYFNDLNEDSSFKEEKESKEDSFDDDFLTSEKSDTEFSENEIKAKKIKKLKTKRGFDIRKMNYILNHNFGKLRKEKKKRKINYKYIQSEKPIFIHEIYDQKDLIKMAVEQELKVKENNFNYEKKYDKTFNRYKKHKQKLKNLEYSFNSKIENNKIQKNILIFNKNDFNKNYENFKVTDIDIIEDTEFQEIKIKFTNEKIKKIKKNKIYKDPLINKEFSNLEEFKFNRYDNLNKEICKLKYN